MGHSGVKLPLIINCKNFGCCFQCAWFLCTFCFTLKGARSNSCLFLRNSSCDFSVMVEIFPHFWGSGNVLAGITVIYYTSTFLATQFTLLGWTVVLLMHSAIYKSQRRSPTSVRYYVKLAFDWINFLTKQTKESKPLSENWRHADIIPQGHANRIRAHTGFYSFLLGDRGNWIQSGNH